VLAIRQILNLQPAPEFAEWLMSMGLMNEAGLVRPDALPAQLFPLLART
jgi:ethanolamine ammonia-lyase large subunit